MSTFHTYRKMELPYKSSLPVTLSRNKANTSSDSNSLHLSHVTNTYSAKEDDYGAALVLASIRDVAKPVHEKSTNWKCMSFPSIKELERYFVRSKDYPTFTKPNYIDNISGEARLRAVSMDVNSSSKSSSSADPSRTMQSPDLTHEQYQGMTLVSPPTSPVLRPMPSFRKAGNSARNMDRRKRYLDDNRLTDDLTLPITALNSDHSQLHNKKIKPSDNSSSSKKIVQRGSFNSDGSKILHKKFSWRNYPELEKFLVDNREEYLYHSALNYTMEQKQYNNKLTQRLIDLAKTSGYTFDPSDFNFVQIRDRIRCYFKSYVQSRKKKGVAICNSDLKTKIFQNKHHDATFHTKTSSRSR